MILIEQIVKSPGYAPVFDTISVSRKRKFTGLLPRGMVA